MKRNTRRDTEVKVGPQVESIIDAKDEVVWHINAAPARKTEKDLAIHHRWLREQGYTRFQQDGEWKLFPEDPEAPELD
jgi:hypothetical protein